MAVIAFANHKGGSGKTTTCQALGQSLAADHGRSVLLVDIDPQSSLTEACGLKLTGRDRTIADAIGGAKPGSVKLDKIIKELSPGLWILPATLDLAGCELQLAGRLMGRDQALRRALEPAISDYDMVLIDCPPSLGLLTINALIASSHVIIPTRPQIQDLRGLRLFLDTLADIKTINTELQHRVLVTFYRGYKAHTRGLGMLAEGDIPTFSAKIGESVAVAEAPGAGVSITEYAPRNPRSMEYKALADEVLAWVE